VSPGGGELPLMADPFSFNMGSAEVGGGQGIGLALADLGDRREDVVMVSPDMGITPVGGAFAVRHPGRFFDAGIAEANAISLAAGLAAEGFIPYVVCMAAFGMLKCAEQIRTDLAFTGLPVRILAAWSGLAMGYFGTSHHAIEDIAVARSITNLTLVAPCDDVSGRALLSSTVDHAGPVVFRLGDGQEKQVHGEGLVVERGRFAVARPGNDVTVIATGREVGESVQAAEVLAEEGIEVGVLDAAYLKPIDEDAIVGAARRSGRILTVEEHNVVGGLGTAVAEVIARSGVPTKLALHGLPDEDLLAGVPGQLYERYELNCDGIVARLRRLAG
jgi:transketolase